MSSSKPTPTIAEMLGAFAVGALTKHDAADTHDGADYDAIGGMGALIWTRATTRDREIFHGLYIDSCRDTALDERIARLGGPSRVIANKGTGTATLVTASPASIVAFIGTRIAVSGPFGTRFYRIAEDVQASNVSSLIVKVEAEDVGNGVAVDSSRSNVSLRWEDLPISSEAWRVVELHCADGTVKETDTEFLARFRSWKRLRRPGYADFITKKMLECGASQVALFESHSVEQSDFGVNRVFVTGSGALNGQTLIDRCRLALDSSVPFGCTTTVGSIVRTPVIISARLLLSDDVYSHNRASIESDATRACQRALSGSQSAYVFRRDSIIAELSRAIPSLQDVVFASPTPEDTDLATLVRTGAGGRLNVYDASSLSVKVVLEGPS